MTSKLVINLAYVSYALPLIASVTVGLSFILAASAEEGSISGVKFYLSNAWKSDASLSTGNWGIPLTAALIAIVIAAKYLQLSDASPNGTGLLRYALLAGVSSTILLIGTCAMSERTSLVTHVALANCFFLCISSSLVCFHIVDYRVAAKSPDRRLTHRSVLLGVSCLSGVSCIAVSGSAPDSALHLMGSIGELAAGFCVLACIASFGQDLLSHNLELGLILQD